MQILRDYMSTPVVSIAPEASIFDAAKIMAEKKIGSLIVKENDEYTGMITRTDIINRVLGKGVDPGKATVGEFCSRPLLTMDYLLTVQETREKLLRKNIKRLAVTEQGKVVGMFTYRDLLRT